MLGETVDIFFIAAPEGTSEPVKDSDQDVVDELNGEALSRGAFSIVLWRRLR